jgi:uncharacterized protein (TIGR02646 family)
VIRIHKPDTVPEKLAIAGVAKAQSHITDYNENPEDYQKGEKKFQFDSNIYGDETVKQALIDAQHKKCCFCERLIGEDGDVEHFRPKGAYTQASKLQYPGYYWLAYDWDNLYLSCSPCNQRNKKNLFPLTNPKKRAQLHSNDISVEKPLLVDPGQEDPSQHLDFKAERPIANSPEGKRTIAILKLDRDILNEERLRHLKQMKALHDVIKIAAQSPRNRELQDLAVQAETVLELAMSDQGVFTAATRAARNTQFRFVL